MRECNKYCFWYDNADNEIKCIFKHRCYETFNNTGIYKYHLYRYEARRLLGDILLDMDRMYNRNDNHYDLWKDVEEFERRCKNV